jgi:hypothetical protein
MKRLFKKKRHPKADKSPLVLGQTKEVQVRLQELVVVLWRKKMEVVAMKKKIRNRLW